MTRDLSYTTGREGESSARIINGMGKQTDTYGNSFLGHFLCSRIPPVENGPFGLDFFSTGLFWSFFLSSVELIL